MTSLSFHVSHNRLFGSIADTSLDSLLDACAKHLITGTLTIGGPAGTGSIVLRAGVADHTTYDGMEGETALLALRALADGSYDLAQRLPELTGAIGSAAEFHGDIALTPIVDIMNHCENQALSCTITIISEFDRAEICYRAGDIERVLFNGSEDENAVVTVVGWRTARFRVSVPPLSPDIGGWPSAGREPTVPFKIADVAKMPPPRKKTERAKTTRHRGRRDLPGMSAPVAKTANNWNKGRGWAESMDTPSLRAQTVNDAPLPISLWSVVLPIFALLALWVALVMSVGGL